MGVEPLQPTLAALVVLVVLAAWQLVVAEPSAALFDAASGEADRFAGQRESLDPLVVRQREKLVIAGQIHLEQVSMGHSQEH